MKVKIKTDKEIALMRQSANILAFVFDEVANIIEDGITTKDIDKFIFDTIKKKNAKPSFKGYGNPPFPASSCISINEEVIHGVPKKTRKIKNGDIVSIDIGVYYNGYHSDRAFTYQVGEVSKEALELINVTQESFFNGVKQIKDGAYLGDVSHAIQKTAEGKGYSLVREFQGHGIGANLHEAPSIPNLGSPSTGIILRSNMVLAIEPMVNAGKPQVYIDDEDEWTVVTRDGSLSAHYEHTVLVTNDGFELLTAFENDKVVQSYL